MGRLLLYIAAFATSLVFQDALLANAGDVKDCTGASDDFLERSAFLESSGDCIQNTDFLSASQAESCGLRPPLPKPHAFYINLKRAPERDSFMKGWLSKALGEGRFTRVEAIDGREFEAKESYLSDIIEYSGQDGECNLSVHVFAHWAGDYQSYKKKSEVAATLSHSKAIAQAYVMESEHALILEDDTVVAIDELSVDVDTIWEIIDLAVNSLPRDWEVLQLTHFSDRPPRESERNLLRQGILWSHRDSLSLDFMRFGAGAYLISRRGMESFLMRHFGFMSLSNNADSLCGNFDWWRSTAYPVPDYMIYANGATFKMHLPLFIPSSGEWARSLVLVDGSAGSKRANENNIQTHFAIHAAMSNLPHPNNVKFSMPAFRRTAGENQFNVTYTSGSHLPSVGEVKVCCTSFYVGMFKATHSDGAEGFVQIDSLSGFTKLFPENQFHLAKTWLDVFGRIISEGKPYRVTKWEECDAKYVAFVFVMNNELRTILVRTGGSEEDISQAVQDFCSLAGSMIVLQGKEISCISYYGRKIFASGIMSPPRETT